MSKVRVDADLELVSSNSNAVTIQAGTLTGNRTLTLPDQSGTPSLVGHGHDGTYAPALGGEPNGFENRDDVTITWSDATRTLTLTGTYAIWSDGVRYVKTNESFTIADTQGAHFIVYNEFGVLEDKPTFIDEIIMVYAFVAQIYWDATVNVCIPWPINETHGVQMPPDVHRYLHLTLGTQYGSGLALSLVTNGNGSLDSHCQFTSTSGDIRDEDIFHTIVAKTSLTSTFPTLYRLGTTEWKMNVSSFPVITSGTGRASYNLNSGGTWSLVELVNNNYVLAHIYAVPGTSHITGGLVAIVGQQSYSTISSAKVGATGEAYLLQLAGLPFKEFKLIATIICKTSNTHSNTVKTAFVPADVGDYIDWRLDRATSIIANASAAWGSITGTLSSQTDLQTELNAKENTANKGVANGYASLDVNGRVPVAQLPTSVMEYQGVWNASTNTPTLVDGVGSSGDIYKVNVAGTQNLGAGSIVFDIGDLLIYNGSIWEKVDTTDAVSSIFGRTGAVVATSGDYTLDQITQGTSNKYLSAANLTDLTDAGDSTLHYHSTDRDLANATGTLANARLPASGTAGTYKSLTVDAKGIVTGGTNPTTLAGYGITDAAPSSHVTDTTVHLTSAQNTWIDAITATATEVNHLAGVTSAVQTQLNNRPQEIVTLDDITTRMDSGFYQTASATMAEGWPEDSNSWYFLLACTHSTTANYYSMQFAANFADTNDLFYRQTATNATSSATSWVRIWSSGNDGTGSGLDADLLDGVDSTGYLRANISTSFTGGVLSVIVPNGSLGSESGVNTLRIQQNTIGSDSFMTFYVVGDYAAHLGLDGTTNDFFVGGWSMGAVKYKLHHDGNSVTSRKTVVVTATSVTAANNSHVHVTAAGQTITLKASPVAGDEISISAGNFTNTIVGRNSSNIESVAENMTIDIPNSTVSLRYIDATRGWIIL